MTQKIIPHLWFDKEAKEAAAFYTKSFKDARITHISVIRDTPSGDCDIVGFQIIGYELMAISAGPLFTFNPSLSFLVQCNDKTEVERIYKELSPGGKVLMELDTYPFSELYAWVQDKYGLSWQLMHTTTAVKQKITPVLMFAGKKKAGKAEEAIKFLTSVFPRSKIGDLWRYEKGESSHNDKPGTIKYGSFELEGCSFAAMDSAYEHGFDFNGAVSFMVQCKDQKEIDYFWKKLSAVPEAEQCGWIKDKYGVSWQIIPEHMMELMAKHPEKKTQAMLKMKKIIIADLEKAGKENENDDV